MININKAASYGAAIATLKQQGCCPPPDLIQRQRLCDFKGFEVMRALKKQQALAYQIQESIQGEARLIERAFGLGNSALAKVMSCLNSIADWKLLHLL